jgi:archaellum component FlaC
MWQPCVVTVHEPTREELEAMVASLREEVSRLKEEVRRLRHDAHEVPPHYL